MRKIIFSVTAHESVECLHDLIINLKKAFVHYDICVLLSLTQGLNNVFDNQYPFVKIITVREDSLPMWGNINLFQQHILNIEYLITNNVDYDFFWFVASNEMFFKIVPENYMDQYGLKILDRKPKMSDQEYEAYYNKFMTDHHRWMWIKCLQNDEHMMNYLHTNKFVVHNLGHEGMVLPPHLISEIYTNYKNNELYERSTYKGYVMEEIFIPTYILNTYHVENLELNCFRYVDTIGYADFNTVMTNLHARHLSIKPVNRNYNDVMRISVRNLLDSFE